MLKILSNFVLTRLPCSRMLHKNFHKESQNQGWVMWTTVLNWWVFLICSAYLELHTVAQTFCFTRVFVFLQSTNLRREIIIKNVPENMDDNAIRRRLTMLSANCGGKVGRVRPHGVPIYFQTPELAARYSHTTSVLHVVSLSHTFSIFCMFTYLLN